MISRKESFHMSYLCESGDSFFQLGYQIINKQKTHNTIKCLKVLYNNKTKIMYSFENLQPLAEALCNMTGSQVCEVVKEIYEIINKNINDGFFEKEAFDVSYEKIFFDKQKKQIMLILLPISGECDFHDGKRWSQRLNETIINILEHIEEDKRKSFIKMYDLPINESISFEDAVQLVVKNNAETGNLLKDTQQFKNKYLEYENGNKIELYKDDMIFGSSSKMADVVIDGSKAVSRMHFRIIKKDNDFLLSDLDSTNHTYHNGRMLVSGESVVLNDGDIIKAANVKLIVRC